MRGWVQSTLRTLPLFHLPGSLASTSPIAHGRNSGVETGPVPPKEVKASEPDSLAQVCYLLAPQFQEVFPSTVVRPNYVVPPKRGRRLSTILSSGEADNTLSSEVEVPSALGEAVHRQLCGWQNYRANTVVSV